MNKKFEIKTILKEKLSQYKDKIIIEYGLHNSPFGDCFIANSNLGICSFEFFSENKDASINKLKLDFKDFQIKQNQEKTFEIVNSIFEINNTTIKILLIGTQFQIDVWKALLKIPFGKTVSYNEISNIIGNAKANRAVGNAVGKNNLAFIVPCHRIIMKNQRIGNYKWGSKLKEAIIDWEKQIQ